jgi:A/G-specific adenine glycosylase
MAGGRTNTRRAQATSHGDISPGRRRADRSPASARLPRAAAPLAGDAAWRRRLARKLLAWYRQHQRILPWRTSPEAYRVWISEIMLQQTQVATVVPYFERFLQAFPDVHSLAAANEHQVLRLWEGLGYYRRARQLHRAAKIICKRHAGQFPRSLNDAQELPGIGRYTAGAVVSIAFDQRAPILEANTVRLYSRLLALRDDPATAAAQKLLWQFAEEILPTTRCGAFNQALMELGSQLCAPRAPRCEQCPLQAECAAFQLGCQHQVPRPKAKVEFEAVREAAVVVQRAGRVLLRRRQRGERWAGLWDFLRFALESRHDHELADELRRKIREQSGLAVDGPRHLITLKHGVTRFRITLDCFSATCGRGRVGLPPGEWQWVAPRDLGVFPLSVTGRKLARLLTAKQATVRTARPLLPSACAP